jgi:hypothetical protein
MHAGTPKQEKLVNAWIARGHRYEYSEITRVLSLCGLLVDNGYKYGTAWLYEPIPDEDLNKIRLLLS